jgi:hypothetical protein
MEFFPSIVSNARTVDVLVNGINGRSESLILVMPPSVEQICFSVCFYSERLI